MRRRETKSLDGVEMNKLRGFLHQKHDPLPKFPCEFPSGCDRQSIGSHSIPRQLLELLAEDGHVITFGSHLKLEQTSKLEAVRIGTSKASKFYCLCSEHDSQMFAPIEKAPPDPSRPDHLFLLAYRCVLKRYYDERAKVFQAISLYSDKCPEKLSAEAIRNLDTNVRRRLRSFVATDDLKVRFGETYLAKNWEERVLFGYRQLRGVRRIASVGCFTPYWDFDGNPIPNHGWPGIIALTVIPIENSTLVSWACCTDHFDMLENFHKGLESGREDVFIARLRDLTLYYCCENTFLLPSFWDSLGQKRRAEIVGFCNP